PLRPSSAFPVSGFLMAVISGVAQRSLANKTTHRGLCGRSIGRFRGSDVTLKLHGCEGTPAISAHGREPPLSGAAPAPPPDVSPLASTRLRCGGAPDGRGCDPMTLP